MWLVYWFYVLSKLADASTLIIIFSSIFLGVISIIALVIHTFNNADEYPEAKKTTRKGIKILLPIFIIAILMKVFIPNKTDMLAIFGIGGVIDYAIGNEEVKQLPDNVVHAINLWTKSFAEDNEDNKEAQELVKEQEAEMENNINNTPTQTVDESKNDVQKTLETAQGTVQQVHETLKTAQEVVEIVK